jgi:hypothetical protein
MDVYFEGKSLKLLFLLLKHMFMFFNSAALASLWLSPAGVLRSLSGGRGSLLSG